MCWAKGDPDSSQQQTTPRRPMEDKIRCPKDRERCKESNIPHCFNDGICCLEFEKKICVCPKNYDGTLCENRIFNFDESRLIMERTIAIAAFSAVLGALVIIMFIALIALQIKYYRLRRRRIMKDDHEMDVIPRPPGGGSKINQPGYSWRESVRRTSKAYKKLQGPSSRSVPDDLFKMGVTIALFNWKAFEQKKEGRGGGGEGGGGGCSDARGRCFSADAGGRGGGGGGEGGGNTVGFGQKTADSQTIQDNGQERVPLPRTEDTVDK